MKAKSFLSTLLAVALVFTLFAALPMNAHAATITGPADRSVALGGNTSFSVSTSFTTLEIFAGLTVSSYQWEYSMNGGTTFGILYAGGSISGTTTATLQVTNAQSGANGYLFRCVVTLSNGTTLTSSAAKLTITGLPAPTNSSLKNVANGVEFAWINNTTAGTSIDVQRSTNGVGFWTINTSPLAKTTTSYLDTGVVDGTQYWYRVKLNDGSGPVYSSPSSITYVKAPTNLTATAGAGGVTLTWTDNSTVEANYYIQRKEAGVYDGWLASPPQNATSYLDTTAQAGKTYTYRVAAATTGGASYSALIEVTITVPSGSASKPATPTNLTATISGMSIILNWQDNSNNETYFDIERREGSGNWYQQTPVGANITTFTDTNVVVGQTYSYRVTARASSSASDPSNIVTITFTAKAGKITLDKTAYAPGEKIVVTYSEITLQMITANAFISPYAAGAAHSLPLDFKFVTAANGTLEFTAPATPGSYEMRLYNSSATNDASWVMTVAFTVASKVATPVATPRGGTYIGEQTVSLTCATEGAAIYYTMDGSTPTTASVRYTAMFKISANVTIKAIAVKPGMPNSDVMTEAYVISSGVTPPIGSGTLANFQRNTVYSSGMFTDVNENLWYGFYRDKVIANAYEYGLMKGDSDYLPTTFRPGGTLSLIEAIIMAVRVHSIYMTGQVNITASGDTWYQGYVDYAIENGIIEAGDFSNYTKAATRAEMAYIFSRCLPSQEFQKKNTVNSLPDVKSGFNPSDGKPLTPYYYAIITLYEAGIVGGNDTAGTFSPNSNITRAEAAAIITRVILPNTRISGRIYG